jgi:hypothetical protein
MAVQTSQRVAKSWRKVPPIGERTRAGVLACIVACTLVFASAAAVAHDVEKGPNGGPIATVQDKHLELTTTGGVVSVYVTDAKHEPIATAGAAGRAVVQIGGKTSTIALASEDGSRLIGKPESPIAKGARIVVSVTLAGGSAIQARFVAP